MKSPRWSKPKRINRRESSGVRVALSCKIILAEVFPGCLNGIEGGDLIDRQLATSSAAIIDAFSSNNDFHDTELTLQSLTNFTGKDIVLCRRLSQEE